MDKINLGFSITKLLLSGTCYGLVCYYDGLNAFVGASTNSVRLSYLANHIMVTACVAFTFVIEPALITASITTPKHFSKTVLEQLFSFAGFVCNITSGSLILSNATSTSLEFLNKKPYLATGSLFIITAVVYLIHCIYAGHRRSRSKD